MTRLYGHWIFCIRENCPEGGGRKCRMSKNPVDYPADGKCLFPEFIDYSEEWEKHGAFETEKAGYKITVYRTVNGAKSPIHGENGKPVSFTSVKDALRYLSERNYVPPELLELDFEIEECGK